MASLIKTHLNLNQDYNFRHISKLRENQRMEFQPCDDDRFLPARLNNDLAGEVLRAKHERIVNKSGRTVKDFNKKVIISEIYYPQTIGEGIFLLIKKITAATWKTLTVKK